MNCLDFRRTLATEPGSKDADYLEHRRVCPECAAAAASAARLEALLRGAVSIDTPERFESRVLMRQSFEAAERSSRLRRRALAIAASVVLAVGLAAGVLHHRAARGTLSAEALTSEVVTLVDKAAHTLVPTETVSGSELEAALRPVGLQVDGEVGKVTFAGRCYVRGVLAGHLVLRGRRAPVSVFLIPNMRIAARASIHDARYAGVLLPVEYGTVAIVGVPGEAFAPVETSVSSAVYRPALGARPAPGARDVSLGPDLSSSVREI